MKTIFKICIALAIAYLTVRLALSERGRISLFGISIGWRNN